jgi:putative membrane protein
MKKMRMLSKLIICGLLFQACGNQNDSVNNNSANRTKVTNNSLTPRVNEATPSAANSQLIDKACKDFAVNAAIRGLMEMKLGQMAEYKSSNERIKAFGTSMFQEHSVANDDLIARATSQFFAIPTSVGEDNQKLIDKLSEKTGLNFDIAYMNMMLEDHKKDISEYTQASEQCTNSSIKDFALQALPILDKHLDSARAITGQE